MKITVSSIFDEATAEEIEYLLSKNPAPEASEGVISSVKQRVGEKIEIKRKKRPPFSKWGVIAAACACVCVAIGASLGIALSSGSPGHSGGDSSVNSLEDLLGLADYGSIIWGSGSVEGDLPTYNEPSDEDETAVEVMRPKGYTLWNGANISNELMEYTKDGSWHEKTLLAITAKAISPPDTSIFDFVYNGRTYREIWDERSALTEELHRIMFLKKFARHYGEFTEEIWQKLYDYDGIDEAYVNSYCDGEEFLMEKIDGDIEAFEARLVKLDSEVAECEKAYSREHDPLPELALLSQKGYYVVENAGIYLVFVKPAALSEVVKDIVSLTDPDILERCVLTLATRDDLGIEPGGVNDVPLPDVEAPGAEDLVPTPDTEILVGDDGIPYPAVPEAPDTESYIGVEDTPYPEGD